MRILLVQRYFWPDVGVAASVLRALAERLASDGHRVTVLSTMPSYNDAYAGDRPPRREAMDGYRVIRLRPPRERKGKLLGRAWSMGVFTAMVAAHILLRGRRYEAIYTSSTPPVVLTAGVRLAARLTRRRYVYHCQDVNPEAVVAAGVLRESWGMRLAAHADAANVRRAAVVVVCSTDMARTLAERGLDCRHVTVINNFFVNYEPDTGAPLSPELRKPAGVFRVLFAGNLGPLQGLDTVPEAARLVSGGQRIQFAFVGAGARAGALRARAGAVPSGSLVLYPHQPLPVVVEMMAESDLGLVILAPGVYRVAYPSKTMAYLEAGCPVLAAVEPESELAAFVRDQGLGATCPPADAGALAAAVVEAAARPVAPAERARIREVGRRHFGRERALDAWSVLFGRLDEPSHPGGGEPGV